VQYDFETIIDRRNTQSVKWDLAKPLVGTEDVLPMWVADMDFQAPPQVLAGLQERTRHGVFGYTFIPQNCYQAVADWMRQRHGWPIQTDWLVFAPGVMPAVHWAIQAVTRPGDRVIVQPPVYPPFFRAVRLSGCEVVENPLRCDGTRYVIDFDHLERLCDARTKMLLLCSPHNPVGRVWTPQELWRLAELCRRHQVLICSDDIHCDLVYSEAAHTPLASLAEEFAEITITCHSSNKTFNLAGFGSAFAIIPNPRLLRDFEHVKQQAGNYSGNLFGMLATEIAYTQGADWLDQLLAYLQQNRDLAVQFIEQRIPGIKPVRPEGNFLIWLDCRALGLDEAGLKAFMLKQARLWLNDGPTFGRGGAGFQRLNIGCPRATLEEALHRMEEAVGRYS
jgi:cysteine-S-conjugate beta-lyase